jgi:hypothetical protein
VKRDTILRSVIAVLLLLSFCLFPCGCAKKPIVKKTTAAGISTIEGGPDLPRGVPTEYKAPEDEKEK